MLKKKSLSLLLVISMLVSVFALFGVTANAVEGTTITESIDQYYTDLYSEVVVTASKGDTIEIDFWCEQAGYRIIQTFGFPYQLLRLSLYNSSGTTQLASTYVRSRNISGYNFNGLIGYNFSENTRYKIIINLVSVNASFTDQNIRLSVTHADGLFIDNDPTIDNYTDIQAIPISPGEEQIVVEHTFYPGDPAIVLRGIASASSYKRVECDGEFFFMMDPTKNEYLGTPDYNESTDEYYFVQNVPYYFVIHPGLGDSIDPITVTLTIG